MLYPILVYVIFLILIFGGMKKQAADSRREYLARLNSMRGLFAIEIVIGHVIRYDNTILYPFGKAMIISVAFFFFISAFGMVVSFQEKENYLKGFLVSKLSNLLVLAVAAFAVNVIIDWICPKDLGFCFTEENLVIGVLSRTNWYLRELALFYILFYFVYKYMKRYRVLLVTVVTLIFIGVVYQKGWITGWYASAMAFPAGLAFGEYFLPICGFLRSKWGKCTTGILVLIGLSSLFFEQDSMIGMVYMKNIMCLAGILILLYFSTYFQVGNRVSEGLNKYSAEIYIFQFVYYYMADAYGWDYRIRILFTLTTTLLTAFVMHPIINMIKRSFHK